EELAREADRLEREYLDRAPAPSVAPAETRPLDPRTRILLEAPILATLLRLAWPNIAVMLVMASTGLIETWWVSRLGTDALAGIALVFPLYMMMQMLSAGAMGGGISSAIARALGGGRREDADALVLHAIVVNLAIGIMCSALVLAFGPALYRALGGEGASLDMALRYSDVVFAGTVLVWLMNALASVIRGGGNMWVPSLWICVGVVLLVLLSPCLIFGLGPFPALGIAGAGVAVVGTNSGGGQKQGALRIALTGGVIAFGLCEAIGLAAAIWPTAWLGLFDDHPRMLAAGAAYLRQVGPAYGFFGLGLSLYFASQGVGRLVWPLSAWLVRL